MSNYFNVFVRNWWRRNAAWHGGREPKAGKRTYLRKHVTEADARAIVAQYNSTHEPGFLSRKAEWESA